METVVLLGDAGTEVMGRQGQDLMDYYLEVSREGSSEAMENISRMGKIKNRISPSEMTMNIEEEAKAMDIQIHSANTVQIVRYKLLTGSTANWKMRSVLRYADPTN
ncbi:unnamed protein product [Brassica rapa]|uniref:Uncharacterized protein n=2 Tax=Brassica campestris TaxID=3711 RepID=A0A8D9M7K7_BRACM|nr:unnamed protein product [Brassica rapa]